MRIVLGLRHDEPVCVMVLGFEPIGIQLHGFPSLFTLHHANSSSKAAGDPLQLIFLCAMWLTAFDAPTNSTLYPDKPQKDHTLMQTIARTNRMCSHKVSGVEKKTGEIVDYYGVLARLKKAIKDYGQGETERTMRSKLRMSSRKLVSSSNGLTCY